MKSTAEGAPCSRFKISNLSKPIPMGFPALLMLLAAAFLLFPKADASAQGEPIIVQTFKVNNANVHRLEPILRPLLSPKGSLSVDRRTNSVIVRDTGTGVETIGQTIKELDAEISSHTFHLQYAAVEGTAKTIGRILGPAGKIVVPDERTHTIYVETASSRLEQIKPLVAQLDRPARQVLIEADILDVSSAKLKELGIDWELRLGYDGGDHESVFNIGVGRDSTDRPATGSISLGTPSVTIPAVFDAAGMLITPEQTIPGSDFSANIQALVEDSSTRTLSRPRILVLDGHTARFEVSTLEPYANTRYNERGTATSLDIQFMDIGIILETIPHINNDGYVLLEVRPEISTLVREEFFNTTIIPDEGGAITNTIRVPVKAQSRANTTIMVRDNQTIAIGGLRTRDDIESIRKVPILGDIPILGIPFRNVNKSNDARELIIFITPHIISPDVSSPEADKLEQDRSSAEPE